MNIFTKIFEFAKEKAAGTLIFQSKEMSGSGKSYGNSDYLKAREISLYLNKALNKRAQKVSEINFTLQQGEKELPIDHELLKLFAKPNAFQTGDEFFYSWQQQKDIFGQVFVLLGKDQPIRMGQLTKITSLTLLRPDWITIQYDAMGLPAKYVYAQPNHKEINYDPAQIIHNKRPCPTNPLIGESLLVAGMRAVLTEDELTEYQQKIIKNGGQVGSVFLFDNKKSFTKNELNSLKIQYKKEYAEARKAGLPLFLAGGAKHERLLMNPEELAFLESKKLSLKDICILTEVPESMLSSVTDIKFDNADQANRGFMRDTIKPLIKSITNALNEKRELTPEAFELGFIDPTPEDTDLILKINESGIKNYYITPNEARANVNRDPIDGGDELLIPFNVSPASQANQPTPAKMKKFDHPLRDKYFRDKYYEIYIKKADKREAAFKRLIEKYFEEQRHRIVSKLGTTRSFRRKSLMDDIFDNQLEIKIGFDMMLPVLENYLIQSGEDAIKLLDTGFDFIVSADIKSWLETKTKVFLTTINETTFEKLKTEFEASLAAAETRDALVSRIQGAYGDISKGRAARIARTEVQGVTQRGTFEGYKQAGAPIKIWVAVRDNRTRESHAFVDGEEVPIHQPFSNGLMYPGDPNGASEEVINCRCTI